MFTATLNQTLILFGADTKLGASMAVISHTLSVLTIPLMFQIFL